MEVVSLSSLPVAALFWQPRPNAWAVSVAFKATFALVPGVLRVHEAQEEIEAEDRYWNDDISKSLVASCDLVPWKAGADVVLVGHAFSSEPVDIAVARLAVGTIHKSVQIVRNRAWTAEGRLLAGKPWTSRPLRYEFAGGGPGTENPAGVAPGMKDHLGRYRVPHMEPVGFRLRGPDSVIPPVGFGPIAPSWPQRARRVGRGAQGLVWGSFRTGPLPDALERAYFNIAPPDQQSAVIEDDAALCLEGLSTEHPRLVTRLPGVHPKAFLRRPNDPPSVLPMPADTLWIDTERRLLTVVWRAVVDIAHPAEVARIVLALEVPGEDLSWEDVTRTAKELGPEAIPRRFDAEEYKSQWGALDFAYPGARPDGLASAGRDESATMPLTPLSAFQAAAMQTRDEASLPEDEIPCPDPDPPTVHPALRAIPNDVPVPPELPSAAATLTLGPDQSFPAALPFPQAPVLGVSVGLDPSTPRESIGEKAVRGGLSLDGFPWQGLAPQQAPGPVVEGGPVPARADPTPARAGRRRMGAPVPDTKGSALAFSNAAADPRPEPGTRAPMPEAPAVDPDEVIELLWFDPELPARLRRDNAFKKLLTAGKSPREGGEDDKAERGRRDVIRVLRHAPRLDGDGLRAALKGAVRDGVFTPPLVVLSGELEMQFDEVETLKAALAAVSPFAPGDPKLKEVSELVQGIVQQPWFEGAARVAEGLLERLRDAFAEKKRGLPAGYLAEHIESTLLLRRKYQRRVMFGREMVRALLKMGERSVAGIPAYLPLVAVDLMPLLRRFRLGVLAEGRRSVEHGAELAVRALAFVALDKIQ